MSWLGYTDQEMEGVWTNSYTNGKYLTLIITAPGWDTRTKRWRGFGPTPTQMVNINPNHHGPWLGYTDQEMEGVWTNSYTNGK